MSGPQVLFGLILLRSFATPSSVTMMLGIGWQDSPLVFCMLEVSSRVKVDSYCLFGILALSFGATSIFPFSFMGATLQLSFLSDLMNDQNLFCFPGFRSFSVSTSSIRFSMCLQYVCRSAFYTLAHFVYRMKHLWGWAVACFLFLKQFISFPVAYRSMASWSGYLL